VVDRLNEKHKTFRKAVKLIKYWNQYKMNGAFNSYYVELAIAREYIRKNQTGNIVSPVSFAVALGFWAFNEAARKGNQDSFIAKAPAVEPGTTDFTKTARLSAVSGRATEAWNYELEGDSDRAIRKWQSIFGDNFGS
jgi:hypothetical protein